MTQDFVYLACLLLCMAAGALASDFEAEADEERFLDDPAIVQKLNLTVDEQLELQKFKVAKRIRQTLKQVKQFDAIEKTVQTNFLYTLYTMANASAIAGTNVSRAAGTIIRGFVQDQFNFASLAFYFPRLIFLDGPSQFIETLRLIRSGSLRVPMDMDSAIDTLINFAGHIRESQIAMNLGTPFLSIFPNIFRGSELLGAEVLYQVFQWFGPISPESISSASVEGLWNRWDTKSSTTLKPVKQALYNLHNN